MNYDFLAGEIFMAIILITYYFYIKNKKPYTGNPCKEYAEHGKCKHQINNN